MYEKYLKHIHLKVVFLPSMDFDRVDTQYAPSQIIVSQGGALFQFVSEMRGFWSYPPPIFDARRQKCGLIHGSDAVKIRSSRPWPLDFYLSELLLAGGKGWGFC